MILAAFLSSLALLASGPSTLVLAQADAPPASSEAPVATTDVDPTVQANAEALAKGEDPFPTGAPTDDYGFMGWCYGALAGHLGLYDKVLPEVRRIETEFPEKDETIDQVMADYASQHALGARILDHYERALTVEEARGKTRGVTRAAAVAKGREVWKGADEAELRQLAQLWMSWGLPGRCQSTANRIAPMASTR